MNTELIICSLRSKISAENGRSKLLANLRTEVSRAGSKSEWVEFRPVGGKLISLGIGTIRWLASVASGKFIPIQSILFLGSKSSIQLLPTSKKVLFLDGIRLLPLTLKVGFRKTILDFDDLMSRRLSRMIRLNEEIALGAFRSRFPKFLINLLNKYGRALLKAERLLLRLAEIKAAEVVDVLVFTSDYERALFERLLRRRRVKTKAKLITLGPIFEPNAFVPSPGVKPSRFIFIGTDALYQNRIAIEAIHRLNSEGKLPFPVAIYGKMERNYLPSQGISFHGFADRLEEVYTPGSILLIPRSVRGGVKTKVIEAFAHGIPVIGCTPVWEGLKGNYLWINLDFDKVGVDRDAISFDYSRAAASGINCCEITYSEEKYRTTLLNEVLK